MELGDVSVVRSKEQQALHLVNMDRAPTRTRSVSGTQPGDL